MNKKLEKGTKVIVKDTDSPCFYEGYVYLEDHLCLDSTRESFRYPRAAHWDIIIPEEHFDKNDMKKSMSFAVEPSMWVAVDTTGVELISRKKLILLYDFVKETYAEAEDFDQCMKYLKENYENVYITGNCYGEDGPLPNGTEIVTDYLILPNGSIEKLIGRKLTPEDGSVRLK